MTIDQRTLAEIVGTTRPRVSLFMNKFRKLGFISYDRESDHRLMNDLQLVVSLLSLQSRTQPNAETATQLSVAANRVAAIARIHRHLHSLQGGQTIAFKRYLDELCEEYSTMLISEDGLATPIVIEGPDLNLAAAIGTPLGLISTNC